jgi:DNA repair photolyase
MIISASRRTDIPAFYSDWFLKRIEEGFVMVRNPMNLRQVSRVSLEPESVDCIVFWTKNPANMIKRLKDLDDRNYHYYFHFTLTPYDKAIEPNLPSKGELVATFIELSNQIGKKRVLWRYDPILITNELDREYHYKSFESLAGKLAGHTEKCIISFVDFYAKCRERLTSLSAREISPEDIYAIAKTFADVGKANDIKIETCAEEAEIVELGIVHGKCIDDKLISRISGHQLDVKKDKSQRELCGCVASVDVGAYNTCFYNCLYCYAKNGSKALTVKTASHDIASPLLSSTIEDNDKITIRIG